MRIHATINERILRRTFRERLKDKRGLTVFDKDLRGFGLVKYRHDVFSSSRSVRVLIDSYCPQ